MSESLDSSLASVAAMAAPKEDRASVVAWAPPLAWMSGIAALFDLVLNRVLVKLGHDAWSLKTLVELDQWGGFARNLSVVSALIALIFCLVVISSGKSGLPLPVRTGIAGFGWVLVPIVTLMTFLPREWTRPELVMVVAGLSHALILLLVLAGTHWRSTKATLGALVLTMLAAFSGVVSMIVTLVGNRTYWEQTERLSNAFRWSGELAYLAVPLAVGLMAAIPWREARGKLALALSMLAAASVAGAMIAWQHAAGRDWPTVLYGALRLDLIPDRYTIVYAVPLGIGWAVTVAAALSKDSIRRQMGAALLLLLSSGYAPRTPAALTTTTLGVALLVRAALAIVERRRER
ncbi:MAG: hypothetical protein WAU39_14485 [Polyangiales bacterium]